MAATILGIESSCDETAAAVVVDGRKLLSSVVASQISIHRKYGGVVPELASREHLRQIVPVVREALLQAKIDFHGLDAIGVTCGPGLVGALLVGITYGKTIAAALGIPLVPVNHLEGHVHAVFLEADAQIAGGVLDCFGWAYGDLRGAGTGGFGVGRGFQVRGRSGKQRRTARIGCATKRKQRFRSGCATVCLSQDWRNAG